MAVGISRPISGGGTTKPSSWGTRFPGRGGDTGSDAFFVTIDGLNAWLKSMEEDFRSASWEAAEALRISLERRVLIPSRKICPIDTGALRSSGWADASVVSGGWIRGSVGYDTDYALKVHEDPDMRHAPPTRWKFLEEPFVMNAPLVAMDVLAAVEKALA
jgi:hypothetical protein